MVTLVAVEARDYCTGNTLCVAMANGFKNEYKKYASVCLNTDLTSFLPKYVSCIGMYAFMFMFSVINGVSEFEYQTIKQFVKKILIRGIYSIEVGSYFNTVYYYITQQVLK